MSYNVNCYLTDAKKIRDTFGCKDAQLHTLLLKQLSANLQELNDDFEDEIDDEKNFQAVLADFINGEIRFPDDGFMYGYVYEQICGYYGELAVQELSVPYMESVPQITHKTFVPIPEPEDFPGIYSIAKEDLLKEKKSFLSAPGMKGVDQETLTEERQEYEDVFDQAIELNRDLVFFLY